MSATGVLEASRSASAQLEAEIRETLGDDARLDPWRIRYWSFLRRATCRDASGAPRALWLKVPKRDPACRDLSHVLLDPAERAAAAREARAHRDLENAFRGEVDLGFVRLVEFRPSSSLLVTEDAAMPHLAPFLRKAARRAHPVDERRAHEALRRAGRFLRIAHARIPVDAAVRP